MTSMNVSLPEDLKEYIESQARQGYSTPSEYVRELIRSDRKQKERERLDSLIVEGLQSGDIIRVLHGTRDRSDENTVIDADQFLLYRFRVRLQSLSRSLSSKQLIRSIQPMNGFGLLPKRVEHVQPNTFAKGRRSHWVRCFPRCVTPPPAPLTPRASPQAALA
jgi:antitoxin ParD1/3/4